MHLCFLVLVTLLASAASSPPQRIFEAELTQVLQKYLGPKDPLTIPIITNLNITTDEFSLLFNATNTVVTGFGVARVTKFTPPFLTKEVTLVLGVDNLNGHTPNYRVNGTLNGQLYTMGGTGDLTINGVDITIKFKAESYSLTPPISACVEKGSLTATVTAEAIIANFQGADVINNYINTHPESIMQVVQDLVSSQSGAIEDAINVALCKS